MIRIPSAEISEKRGTVGRTGPFGYAQGKLSAPRIIKFLSNPLGAERFSSARNLRGSGL